MPSPAVTRILRAPWTPKRLPNLAAWFRFGQGITSAAGAVSQWADQSGNGRHLKQATGAAQPALQADGSILFDGTSDFLKCDAFTLAQPETVYVLFKQITWTLNSYIFDGDGAASGILSQRGTSPELATYAGSSVVANNSNLAVGVYGAVATVINGASSLIQVNNTTPTTGNPGVSNMGGFTIGGRGDGTTEWGNIQFKEAIVYAAAHDAVTRARVIAYLSRVGAV